MLPLLAPLTLDPHIGLASSDGFWRVPFLSLTMTASPEVIRQLDAIQWKFAESDLAARADIAERIARTGERSVLITYSDLVAGVTFRLPTVSGGDPFQIDTQDWRDLDRAILGEFLGHISSETYRQHGFFASALVVGKDDRRPSGPFFKWIRDLGLIRSRGSDAEDRFWWDETSKAHTFYSQAGTPREPL